MNDFWSFATNLEFVRISDPNLIFLQLSHSDSIYRFSPVTKVEDILLFALQQHSRFSLTYIKSLSMVVVKMSSLLLSATKELC